MDRLPHLASFVTAPASEASELAVLLSERFGYRLREGTLERAEGTDSSGVLRGIADPVGGFAFKRSDWFPPSPTEGYAPVLRALEAVYGCMEDLRAVGAPVPRAFRSRDGSVVFLDHGLPSVAMEYVTGGAMTFRIEDFAAVGKAMGALHRVGRSWIGADPARARAFSGSVMVVMPYEESRDRYRSGFRDVVLSGHDCDAPDVCAAIRDSIGTLDDAMAFVDASGVNEPSRVSGILHNDINAGNVVLAEDGSVRAFLDIDQAGVGPLVWDIGNTLASFATKLRTDDPTADIEPFARAFLRAYHAEQALPAEEYRLILSATQRWDCMRVLRSLRRHHEEAGRLPGLLRKIPERLLPRLAWAPRAFGFLTDAWIRDYLA